MTKTGFDIDWTWASPLNEIDTVWFGRTDAGSMLVASNPQFDALVIADTQEEMLKLGNELGKSTFMTEARPVEAVQASLFALATRWRWFIYNGKARFLHEGKGWIPQSLAEYPGVRASIAPDPMAMVFFARGNDGIVKRNDVPLMGGDVHELIAELHEIDEENHPGMEFSTLPLFVFASRYGKGWFRGREHDLVEALSRNPRLLLHHEMIDPSLFKGDEE